MGIYFIVVLIVLSQIGFKSSRLLITLYALELGANNITVGALISAYGFFPLFLAVYAGKVSDRFGVRYPILLGSLGVGLGLLLPYLYPHLITLPFSATVTGSSFIFCQVSFHNLIGLWGDADERTRNYSIMSLGAAVSGFIGPLITGFSIDHFGHVLTYLYVSATATISGLFFFFSLRAVSHFEIKSGGNVKKRVSELIKKGPLLNIFITSGIVITGVDLYSFYFPIYGHSIGFSASLIGTVLSTFAIAAFVVRITMPAMVKKLGEEKVLTYSLLVSGGTYLLFPFFENAVILSLISFVLGLGLGCGQPLSTILTFNRSPSGRSGEALGIRITINKFIQLIVPIFFGSIGNVFGLVPVFWTNALLLLGGGHINSGRKG